MLQDAIKACKIFRSSDHKDAILNALDDAMNVELVQQLSSQLDDKDVILEPDTSNDKETKDSSDIENGDNSNESNNNIKNNKVSLKPAKFTPNEPSSSGVDDIDVDEGVNETGSDENTTSESDIEPNSSPKESSSKEVEPENKPELESKPESQFKSEPTNASRVIKKRDQVKSATVLYNNDVKGTQIPELNTEVLKGDLNISDSTAGVTRIQIKENELWIYYNDTVNLNDIMEAVIDKLIACTYSYLEFNRLARKNNAIVFDILDHAPRTLDKNKDESKE